MSKCHCDENCACGCQEGKECTCGKKCKCGGKIFAALLLALGLAAGGFFPGYYYYKAKMNANTVTVKGLAEMNVQADLAVWDLKFVVTGNDLTTAREEMLRQGEVIAAFLQKNGFEANEISFGRLETNDLMANPYRGNDLNGVRFIVTQTATVRSHKVNQVEQTLGRSGELVAQGVVFDTQYGSPVSYVFTRLNEIKPQMLEEATRNAAAAAAEFAKSSHSKVGKIHRASQGVFSILPRVQTMNASELGQIEKQVRVVSTVEYFLE